MKKVYVGGAFTSAAAIMAAWIAFGLGGTPNDTACPLPAFPDATCTGIPAGTVLTAADVDGNGDLQVTVDNTVIDALEVPGQIIVSASGVHISRSSMANLFIEFNSRAWNDLDNPLVIEDSLVDCGNTDENSLGTSKPRTGVYGRNFQALRNNITGCENGFSVDSNAVIRDNYIHDLWTSADPDGPHTDGLESAGGSDLIIQHNTFRGERTGCHTPEGDNGSCNGTSAINIANSAALPPLSNSLVKANLLSGGTYTLYCPIPTATNFKVIGNYFSTSYGPKVGQYGPAADCGTGGETVYGNVYYETGLPVTAF